MGVSEKAKKMAKMYRKSMRNVVSVNELREGTWRKMRLEKAVSEGKMPLGLSGGSFTFNLEVQAEFHRCRRGLSRGSFTLDLRAAAQQRGKR